MRKKFFCVGVFFLTLFGFGTETNHACWVAAPSDRITNISEYNYFVRDYNKSTAVFAGKIIEKDRFKAKFRAEKVWKGDIPREFVMSTGIFPHEKSEIVTMSSCDYRFSLGESYLVFAVNKHFGNFEDPLRDKRYGRVPQEYRNLLWASKSGRTKPLAEAKLGIENLDRLVKPRKAHR